MWAAFRQGSGKGGTRPEHCHVPECSLRNIITLIGIPETHENLLLLLWES